MNSQPPLPDFGLPPEPDVYAKVADLDRGSKVSRETKAQLRRTSGLGRTRGHKHACVSGLDIQLKKPAETRIISVVNPTPRVGRTSTVVNLAAVLAEQGLRVLVLDLSASAQASRQLGLAVEDRHASLTTVLVRECNMAENLRQSSDFANLYCLPGHSSLSGLEFDLHYEIAGELRLKRALVEFSGWAPARGWESFDYVLIDCAPSLGMLTINALAASKEVLIPVDARRNFDSDIEELVRILDAVRKNYNGALCAEKILLNIAGGYVDGSMQGLSSKDGWHAGCLLAESIPLAREIQEAARFEQVVSSFEERSEAADAYLRLVQELDAIAK